MYKMLCKCESDVTLTNNIQKSNKSMKESVVTEGLTEDLACRNSDFGIECLHKIPVLPNERKMKNQMDANHAQLWQI